MKSRYSKRWLILFMGLIFFEVYFLKTATGAEINAKPSSINPDIVDMVLSGKILKNDCQKFKSIFEENDAVRYLILEKSGGGNATEAQCISSFVHKNRIATMVDKFCFSACSRIWASGYLRMLLSNKSMVGFHGNYLNKKRHDVGTKLLKLWLETMMPNVSKTQMHQWLMLPHSELMVYTNHTRSLCSLRKGIHERPKRTCKRLSGSALTAGLLKTK